MRDVIWVTCIFMVLALDGIVKCAKSWRFGDCFNLIYKTGDI
jgi:hypothetical protein